MSKFGASLGDRLARFEQQMDTTDGTAGSKPRQMAKFRGFQPSPIERCQVCDNRVYIQEKITADTLVYHKTCFKCVECKRTLSLGNYASLDGQIYCKPHFISLFKTKGNYEEGFGKERHKNKWLDKENSAPIKTDGNQNNNVAQQPDIIKSTVANEVFHSSPMQNGGDADVRPATVPAIPERTRQSSIDNRSHLERYTSSLERQQRRSSNTSNNAQYRRPSATDSESSLRRFRRPSDRSGSESDTRESSVEYGQVDALGETRKKKRESFHFKAMSSVKSMWESVSKQGDNSQAPHKDMERETRKPSLTGVGIKSRYETALKESASKPVIHPKPVVRVPQRSPSITSPTSTDGSNFDFEETSVATGNRPKVGNLQNLLAKWSSFESNPSPVSRPSVKHAITPPREQSPGRPLTYTYEEPIVNKDMVREADPVEDDVNPLARDRFNSHEEPTPVSRQLSNDYYHDNMMYNGTELDDNEDENESQSQSNLEEEGQKYSDDVDQSPDVINHYGYGEYDNNDDTPTSETQLISDGRSPDLQEEGDNSDSDTECNQISEVIPSPIGRENDHRHDLPNLENSLMTDDDSTLDFMVERNVNYNETLATTQAVMDANRLSPQDPQMDTNGKEGRYEPLRARKTSDSKYMGLRYGSDEDEAETGYEEAAMNEDYQTRRLRTSSNTSC